MTAFNYCLADFSWGEGIAATTTKILATLDWKMAAYEALSLALYMDYFIYSSSWPQGGATVVIIHILLMWERKRGSVTGQAPHNYEAGWGRDWRGIQCQGQALQLPIIAIVINCSTQNEHLLSTYCICRTIITLEAPTMRQSQALVERAKFKPESRAWSVLPGRAWEGCLSLDRCPGAICLGLHISVSCIELAT